MTKKKLITITAVGIPLLLVLYIGGYFSSHIGYWTKGESVYYGYFDFKGDFKLHCDTLKNADLCSFELLDSYWAKDKEHVYHCGETTRLDAGSFEMLDRYFVRDSAGIHFASYRSEDILLGSDVDIPTFKWLQPDSWRSLAVDSGHIYIIEKTPDYIYRCVSYELARPLVPVSGSHDIYLTDSVNVFCVYGKIDGADPSTFREINAFWVDANHVYVEASIVDGADPKTISVVPTYCWSRTTKELKELTPDYSFVRDSRHVFSTHNWVTDNISNAAPESFVVLSIESDHKYAFDKNGFYMMHDTEAFHEFKEWCLTSGAAPLSLVEALPLD